MTDKPDPGVATMADVAARAGVSPASVSRVLTGSRPVTADVAERVRDAARELGYAINQTASSLRRRRTGVVGIVVPQITNPYFPVLVDAVEQHLHEEHDLELMLCQSREDTAREASRLTAMRSGRVDGIVIIPVDEEASRSALADTAASIPMVQVDRWVEGVDIDLVATDQQAAMRLVVDHLASIGRREIAFVGGPPTESSARARHEAARSAVERTDMQLVAALDGAYTIDFGRHAADVLLERPSLPDGIVCANDLIAFGVLRVLQARGVAVPDDVAVTGMDGVGYADLAMPRLTTAVQPVSDVAAAAVSALARRIGGATDRPRRELVAPWLRVGGSTVDQPDQA